MKIKLNQKVIRDIRTSMGWTQEDLADASNVHTRTIQRIERDGVASIQSLNALARAFGVEAADLQHVDFELPANDSVTVSSDDERITTGVNIRPSKEIRRIKEFFLVTKRIDSQLSYRWLGWPLLFMGGFLTVNVLLMTQANLNKTTLFYVFFPGTAIGLLLMLCGGFLLQISERATKGKTILRKASKSTKFGSASDTDFNKSNGKFGYSTIR